MKNNVNIPDFLKNVPLERDRIKRDKAKQKAWENFKANSSQSFLYPDKFPR